MARDRYGIKFTAPAARRIAEVTRHIEQRSRGQAPPLGGPSEWAGLTYLVVTTACNPISGLTPGANGRGKIQQFDGTIFSDLEDGAGSTVIAPILNCQEKTVAVGALAQCSPGPGGKFHLVNVDKCSRLS